MSGIMHLANSALPGRDASLHVAAGLMSTKETTTTGSTVESGQKGLTEEDDTKMWLRNAKKKKTMCVQFLFVQPGVVSTCSVTERISFVNVFAAVFQEGRFGVRLVFLSCWTIFEALGCDC